jgi:hypothetical protein
MLQKKRFGDDRAGASRSHDPDDRDDHVSHQVEPIAHASNDDRGWGLSQDYKPGFSGNLSIRHGHVRIHQQQSRFTWTAGSHGSVRRASARRRLPASKSATINRLCAKNAFNRCSGLNLWLAASSASLAWRASFESIGQF